MHVELTEKEPLSCGLPMYLCSLHEKECPCCLCSIAHVTVTWGCALQVTVSTSKSCCCPLQLFRVVAPHWVAMRFLSLIRLNTSLERSVEPPLASMCSLDKEKVFPRIDNAETLTSRETTRSPARRFAARSLLVSCPPGTMVSSYRRSSLSLLAANSSGCLFGKAAHPPGFVPVWCQPEQESLESDEPPGSCCHCSAVSFQRRAAICVRCRCLTRLVFASVTSSFGNTKGKLFTKFKISNGEHLFDFLCIASACCRAVQTAYAVSAPLPLSFRTFTYARTVARASIDLGVQRRETRAADKLRTNDRQTLLIYRYRFFLASYIVFRPFCSFFSRSLGVDLVCLLTCYWYYCYYYTTRQPYIARLICIQTPTTNAILCLLLLLNSNHWEFLFDLGDSQLVFPPEIAVTTQRPDIVIFLDQRKQSFLLS